MVAVMQGGGEPTQAEFHEAITNRADRWFAACLKITRNRAMAEDAVQEALLSAWAKRSQFHHDARLDTWIHRIAVNAALQLLRKNRPASFEPLDFEIPDDADSQEDVHHAGELERDLGKALTHLSDIERICFVLKHIEQWRLKEIAEELDINVGVVKQALFRGVGKLRKQMTTLQGV
ncbi:MAG: RNA polymerase sigma factor [Proteobacteria bacterium]|nr:RNA polymerase sigma factor [Pseudomonadota bacterium]